MTSEIQQRRERRKEAKAMAMINSLQNDANSYNKNEPVFSVKEIRSAFYGQAAEPEPVVENRQMPQGTDPNGATSVDKDGTVITGRFPSPDTETI